MINIDTENFREQFDLYIEQLNDIPFKELPPVEERNAECEELIELYFDYSGGKLPSRKHLKALADYVLADDLKNDYGHKTAKTDYPIQTGHSLRHTPIREFSTTADILDYLHSKYHKRLDSLFVVSTANKEET